MTVYLDNAATTRPTAAVTEAMRLALTDGYFNPSALYAPAVAAQKRLDACRALIMQRLRARGGRVTFTSGGTEADNLAILGALPKRVSGQRIVYSAGEHPAVRESCLAAAALGFDVLEAPLDGEGRIDLAALAPLLTPDTRMLCLMQVNNETGAVQPLREAAALRDRRCPGALLHVDGVQGFARLDCPVEQWGIDSYALSAHKLGGPKGVGALWTGDRVKLKPILHGGGQEGGLRSGTENSPGIAGLEAALKGYPEDSGMRALKLRLYEALRQGVPGLSVNGPEPDSEAACDHILNLSFPPVRAETMLHALEAKGVYVGNGSACSSRGGRLSRVLKAMGRPDGEARCAIRFSLAPGMTEEEIDHAARAVKACYEALKAFVRH